MTDYSCSTICYIPFLSQVPQLPFPRYCQFDLLLSSFSCSLAYYCCPTTILSPHSQSPCQMTGALPRGQPLPALRSSGGSTRAERAPNILGEQDKVNGCAVNTPTNEDEGLRALRQLRLEISQLWKVVGRRGGICSTGHQGDGASPSNCKWSSKQGRRRRATPGYHRKTGRGNR
jgi:hypothetical protein